MYRLVGSIFLALLTTFLCATAEHYFNGGGNINRHAHGRRVKPAFLSRTGDDGWIKAILVGLFAGLVDYFMPVLTAETLIVAPFALLAMVALHLVLIMRWREEGSSGLELALYIILVIVISSPTILAAEATARLVTVGEGAEKLGELVLRVPGLISVASIGFFIINRFYYLYEEDLEDVDEAGEDEELAYEYDSNASRNHMLGIIFIALTTLILLGTLLSLAAVNFKWPTLSKQMESAEEGYVDDSTADFDDLWIGDEEVWEDNSADRAAVDSGEAAIQWIPWYGFYNLSLKGGDVADDYNFGYNLADYAQDPTAADYDRDFRERMKVDPALAAAATAWLDANVGTRYLGEFYESCQHDWAKTINAAKDRFMTDQAAYYRNLDAFFAFLDTGTISVKTGTNLVDQMYMNPYTESGIPDVIVLKTDHPEGLFLVYTFSIKGNMFEVAYRTECGYQPTNVEKVMGIKPQENPVIPDNPQPQPTHSPVNPVVPTATPAPQPTNTPAPQPTNTPIPTATPTPKPTATPTPQPTKVPQPTNTPAPQPTNTPIPTATPTPKPTATSTPIPTPTIKPKDPTKGTQGDVTKPNDDPGPGPDTNNGVGAQTSTKDQPQNSDHFESYDEYRETIKHLETVNQTQATGNTAESSTPSTNSPSVQIDTPASEPVHIDNGSGGNINEPTKISAPATAADTGEPITTNPGGAWGGPPD